MFMRLMVSALIALVPSIPILLVAWKEGMLKARSQIIVEEAKKAGRVSIGYIVRRKNLRYDPEDKGKFLGDKQSKLTYEYIVDGKAYTWSGLADTQEPPTALDFYYPEGKPHQAVPEGYFDPGHKYILIQCLPLTIWVIVYWTINIIWPM